MLAISKEFQSPNFDLRPDLAQPIKFVIIHFTEISFTETLERFCSPEKKVSSHYLINENGGIYSLVDDDKRAWHAGESSWRGFVKLNDISIGIELVNNGLQKFDDKLFDSLIVLCAKLKLSYNIPAENFIGHSDIAPSRKIDPGLLFPWQKFSKHGFGLWPKQEIQFDSDIKLIRHSDTGEVVANLQNRLRKLGYRLDITGKFDVETVGVVRAFQSHFCPELISDNLGVEQFLSLKLITDYKNFDNIYEWNAQCEKILDCLLEQTVTQKL